MKKINRHVPDVSQGIADRGTEIIERHFNAYGVKRASELPEEGKVRLFRRCSSTTPRKCPGGWTCGRRRPGGRGRGTGHVASSRAHSMESSRSLTVPSEPEDTGEEL